MVRLSVPTPVLEIPEPVNGSRCVFRVIYSVGRSVDYRGSIHSVSALFDALVNRLSCDSSICKVSVVLESGRLLCLCYRY